MNFQTGYYGILGGTGGKVHVTLDGKPLCGWNPRGEMKFQWCSEGISYEYIECRHCKKKASDVLLAVSKTRK